MQERQLAVHSLLCGLHANAEGQCREGKRHHSIVGMHCVQNYKDVTDELNPTKSQTNFLLLLLQIRKQRLFQEINCKRGLQYIPLLFTLTNTYRLLLSSVIQQVTKILTLLFTCVAYHFYTLLSHFTSSCSQIILSLFSSVSVDNGLKRNLEQRDVKGSIILQGKIIITAKNIPKKILKTLQSRDCPKSHIPEVTN